MGILWILLLVASRERFLAAVGDPIPHKPSNIKERELVERFANVFPKWKVVDIQRWVRYSSSMAIILGNSQSQ